MGVRSGPEQTGLKPTNLALNCRMAIAAVDSAVDW